MGDVDGDLTGTRESPEAPERYRAEIDLSNWNSSHVQLILLAGSGRDILEIGTASGDTTRVLRERGNRVTGIEIDPMAAERAARYCERMVVGDVERLDLASTFGTQRFDAVVLGDVLEHLVDPLAVLEAVRGLVAPGGRVLASIPNVAHASVRLSLLLGRFRYTREGLLDATHLRFFTRETIGELFADARYEILSWSHTTLGIFDTDADLAEDEVPALLVEAVQDEPDALVFQHIIEARPAEEVERTAPPERPRGRPLGVLWGLPEPDAYLGQRLEELRSRLAQREEQVAEKDLAIRSLDDELTQLRGSRLIRAAVRLSSLLGRTRRRRPAP